MVAEEVVTDDLCRWKGVHVWQKARMLIVDLDKDASGEGGQME